MNREFKFQIKVCFSENKPDDIKCEELETIFSNYIIHSIIDSNLVVDSDAKSGLEVEDMVEFKMFDGKNHIFELSLKEMDLIGDEFWEEAINSGDEISFLMESLMDALEYYLFSIELNYLGQ